MKERTTIGMGAHLFSVASVLFLFGCGAVDDADSQSEDLSRPCTGENCQKDCLIELPLEVSLQNQEYAKQAKESRLAAVEQERTRFSVSPLRVSQVLGYGFDRKAHAAKDPYPQAVARHLNPESAAHDSAQSYAQFHGFAESSTVYETEPGSGKFFVVEGVFGDGAGGASLTDEPHPVEPKPEFSLHSWHVTADNQLIRLNVKAERKAEKSISVCGCGPGETEIFASSGLPAEDAAIAYPQGIFMLPGAQVPTLLDDTMTATYEDKTIKVDYVPRPGQQCISPVC